MSQLPYKKIHLIREEMWIVLEKSYPEPQKSLEICKIFKKYRPPLKTGLERSRDGTTGFRPDCGETCG